MALTVSTFLNELDDNFVGKISKLRVNLRKSSQASSIETPRLASSDQLGLHIGLLLLTKSLLLLSKVSLNNRSKHRALLDKVTKLNK